MEHPIAGSVKLVPGAHNLAGLHERAIPQKDQLCGPFWGALTLTAAGHPTDQDEVALLGFERPFGLLHRREADRDLAPRRREVRGGLRAVPACLLTSSERS